MAAAASGDGRITVLMGGDRPPAIADAGRTGYLMLPSVADGSLDDMSLNAASVRNILRFTYTAYIDDGSAPDLADDNDTPIDMSGGSVRIGFPGHWEVSKNYVRVEEINGTTGSPFRLYETGNEGGFIGDLDTAAERETAGTSRVTLDADKSLLK